MPIFKLQREDLINKSIIFRERASKFKLNGIL
jgi:hypothetical protein